MKKLKSLAFFALFLSALSFTSCDGDVEPLDPALNPGDGGGGGTPSGDYWPAAVNNEWTMEMNGVEQTPMKMIGTDTFNGATYYKFSSQSSGGVTSATTWLHKANGVYTLKVGDLNLNMGGITGTQTGYEMVILKDLAVGQTWSGTYQQSTTYTGIPAIVQSTTYTGTIEEKGITLTVDGVEYTDVIKAHIYQHTESETSMSIVNTDYWYAKNVGPIKSVTYSGSGTYESILVDYVLH
ncbi:hypothetical protein [Flavobacterium suncheonense]|uniref:hypothetical protein n=1 Tax=Flavobacterium suncheonense TaxID=350894 RepID=UPI000411A265|nr:hypothetical protein [Flavobacterium suncheonense]